MTTTLQSFVGFVAVAGFLATAVLASPPLPDSLAVHYTIDQAAKLMIGYCNAAAEAVIEETVPITIEQSAGRCTWVTKLRLRILQPIWGEFTDERANVLTFSLPEGFSPTDDCSQALLSDELPAPQPGYRGIFFLVGGGDDWRQILPDVASLPSIRGSVFAKDGDSVTVRSPGGATQRWSYDEYIAALKNEARTHTIAAMSKRASTVFLATLGSYGSREVSHGVQSWRARFPLAIESIYRGSQDLNPFLTLSSIGEGQEPNETATQGIIQGLISFDVQKLSLKRVLILGNRADDGDVLPIMGGLLSVDSEGKVALPARRIAGGKIKVQWQSLSSLEDLLR